MFHMAINDIGDTQPLAALCVVGLQCSVFWGGGWQMVLGTDIVYCGLVNITRLNRL